MYIFRVTACAHVTNQTCGDHQQTSMLQLNLGIVPGKSTKEMSVYSGPIISKQIISGENESSLGAFKGMPSSRNVSGGKLGFRMASWARNTRPSNNSLSEMVLPKGSLDCPNTLCPSDTRRKNTRQDHSGPSPCIRRHSIGHLQGNKISLLDEHNGAKENIANLVHATPGALGSVTPEMAWMSDDFPELCEPMTTMIGRSRSRSSLFVCQPDVPMVVVEIGARGKTRRDAYPMSCNVLTRRSCLREYWVSPPPTMTSCSTLVVEVSKSDDDVTIICDADVVLFGCEIASYESTVIVLGGGLWIEGIWGLEEEDMVDKPDIWTI